MYAVEVGDPGVRCLALGNVFFDRDEVRDGAGRIQDRGYGLIFGIQTPVFPAIDDLAVPRASGEDGLPQFLVERRGMFARLDQVPGVLADGFFSGVPGELGER